RANLAHGRLPSCGSLRRNHPMALRCLRVGAVHSITTGNTLIEQMFSALPRKADMCAGAAATLPVMNRSTRRSRKVEVLAFVGLHNPQRRAFPWLRQQDAEPSQQVEHDALDPSLRSHLVDVSGQPLERRHAPVLDQRVMVHVNEYMANRDPSCEAGSS